MKLPFKHSDGGRSAAGFKGHAGDCVCRAVAIASGKPYAEVYAALSDGAGSERKSKGRTARNGIRTSRKWFKDYMQSLGFVWTSTMQIGSGCTVHLRAGEVPMQGRHVVMVSKHAVALVEGVLIDTHDASRDGNRCVYGYWSLR
jgi:hypothetical protein